jgi:glutaredoxin-related protein
VKKVNYIDVINSPLLKEVTISYSNSELPLIYIKGEFIGSYQDLLHKHKYGELDSLLLEKPKI